MRKSKFSEQQISADLLLENRALKELVMRELRPSNTGITLLVG